MLIVLAVQVTETIKSFLMKVRGSTKKRSHAQCSWADHTKCTKQEGLDLGWSPAWNYGSAPGMAPQCGGSLLPVPPQGLPLEASFTCSRGEDQLFSEPPATMLSLPIKILFQSQQGSWQPWVSPAG